MNWIDIFEPFGGKCFLEILFADSVDAMTGERFSPLINKEPILAHRFWRYAILFNIDLEEMAGLGVELYEPEPIPFTHDR